MKSSLILFLIVGALLAAVASVSGPRQALSTMLVYIIGGIVATFVIVRKTKP